MSHLLRYLSPLIGVTQLLAQFASITGDVTDRSGKPVSSASVQLVSRTTGSVRRTTTSERGDWSIPMLPADQYRLSISGPGFDSISQILTLPVDAHLRLDKTLETQTQTRFIPDAELHELPNLFRDPWRFAELAGNASFAGTGTRGAGVAINGQRESSTAILLDGMDHKDEFTGSAGQPLPLDSIREFSVLTNTFTADYGRASGGVVNAVGRRGGNLLHGSAYEFNRLARWTSNSFQDNANGIPRPGFVRNQFGGAVGGAIRPNKLFFFADTEVTLVRSHSTSYAWIPAPEFLARTAPNTQNFFQSLGQLRSDAHIIGGASLNQLSSIFGRSPCLGLVCATLPASLNLFNHVAWTSPGDAGAGVPQNAWNSYNRVDYQLSPRTNLSGRYSIYRERDQSGSLATSPYADYDLGQHQFDQSILLSLLHEWNPRRISRTSIAFDRLTIEQQGLTSRGVVPTMYANPVSPLTIGSDSIAFPGYNPFAPGTGGAFGGPENIFQLRHDSTWIHSRHTFQFGGTYIYIRDNRTDAAYQTAVDSLSNGGGIGAALVGLLFGTFAHIQVAVDPQGRFPCGQAPSCALELPVTSPDFSRSNRFHDAALYAQDTWRLTRRLTLNLGIRWDYFGVQHNKNPNLDSNWYAPDSVGFPDDNLLSYLFLGGLQTAPNSPVGGLYKPDRKNFAPRAGVAWDVFGNGRTSVRGGYAIAWDRNFGNVTFNTLRNLPNYAVLDVPGAITTNNFGPLADTSGSIALPPSGARIINPSLKTAYAVLWSASIEQRIRRGIVYRLDYNRSRGIHLYSVSYPNQGGFRNAYLPEFCTGQGDCRTPPNPYYSEDVGYRGNQGFSTYRGVTNHVAIENFLHRGISLTANYTLSHAIDNLSSTFFESGGRGVANRFGDRNITINNGLFDLGLLDPYQPNLDRGDADFDVRHSVTLTGNWAVPGWRRSRYVRVLTSGWSVSPLFLARSGQPFSVFDTIAQTLDLNAPRATFIQAFPKHRNTMVSSVAPDTFHLITFYPAQFAHEPNLLTPGSQWPANMSARNAFRAPGFWNLDLAVSKNTKLTEKLGLELRGEMFNVFNHANLYVIGRTADVGSGNTVDACFGCTGSSWDRRQVQIAARLTF